MPDVMRRHPGGHILGTVVKIAPALSMTAVLTASSVLNK